MAQHIIRDSKGRVDKILNDKEYAEYQKWGCYTKIILFIIVSIIAIIFIVSYDDSTTKESKETSSSQGINSVSTSSEETQAGTASIMVEEQGVAPTIDEEASDMQEEPTASVSDVVEETPDEETQHERKLSRKERRTLRKAQRGSR